MKILTVSDEECAFLWDFYTPGRLKEYDLILSAGDLKSEYLRFLVTMARCPVLYVHGNHDGHYETDPPEGCDCIDDEIVLVNGLRILGLGGCLKYRHAPHHYTEAQMRSRITRLKWQIRRMGGVDIVLTHAPPRGLGDGEDVAHWGFEALKEFLDQYQPRYLIHGHVHLCYGGSQRVRRYGATTLVNACQRYVLETEDVPVPESDRGQVYYKPWRRGKVFFLRRGSK